MNATPSCGDEAIDGSDAGVFAINAAADPSQRNPLIGFRCAR